MADTKTGELTAEERHRRLMQVLGKTLDEVLEGCGFALLVFEFDKPAAVNYISNAERPDMLLAMKEFIARSEGRMHDAPASHQ